MILYKLTDQNMRTHKGFQWELNVPSKPLSGEGGLCSPGLYHAYLSPELAVLLNPIHVDFKSPRLFVAEGQIEANDRDLKVGSKSLILNKEIPLPSVSSLQRIRFGILCAKAVYSSPEFNAWADAWLNAKDRSPKAAGAAAWAADKNKIDLVSIARQALTDFE